MSVPMKAQDNPLVRPPQLDQIEDMKQKFDYVKLLYAGLTRCMVIACPWSKEEVLWRATEFVSSDQMRSLMEAIEAYGRPATVDEIARSALELVGSYPLSGKDVRIFSANLLEDIGSVQPSIGALEIAMRELRRTSKFLPVVSEVLEALQNARERLQQAKGKVQNIPDLVAELRRELEESERRQRRLLEDQGLTGEGVTRPSRRPMTVD